MLSLLYGPTFTFVPSRSVAQSCLTLCDHMNCSMPGFPVHTNSQSLLKLMSIEPVIPSNPLILWHPLLLLPSIFLSTKVFFSPMSRFFIGGSQRIGVSPSASVLLMSIQDWFPPEWTNLILLMSKGLQESSPTPQFKSINSSVLSFLYSATLTSIHDHWKNHSFD